MGRRQISLTMERYCYSILEMSPPLTEGPLPSSHFSQSRWHPPRLSRSTWESLGYLSLTFGITLLPREANCREVNCRLGGGVGVGLRTPYAPTHMIPFLLINKSPLPQPATSDGTRAPCRTYSLALILINKLMWFTNINMTLMLINTTTALYENTPTRYGFFPQHIFTMCCKSTQFLLPKPLIHIGWTTDCLICIAIHENSTREKAELNKSQQLNFCEFCPHQNAKHGSMKKLL